MNKKYNAKYFPYKQTGAFSKIVLDYVSGASTLQDFYQHPVSIEGIKSAIEERKKFSTNRKVLVDEFSKQYQNIDCSEEVRSNITALSQDNCFTVCTAHQPNLFTGHLYFIYKIFHTIKLANFLKNELPEYYFVPVFFMGSEDADLEELNHVVVNGEKYEWKTNQTGAVGRMKVDRGIISLVEKLSGQLLVLPGGPDIVMLIRKCFTEGTTIEQATFLLVHSLFNEFGLLVLLPDSAAFKREMISVFEDDIFNHTSSGIVSETSNKLAKDYKAQAYPREINLFYLIDNVRNRIVEAKGKFVVHDTDIVFTKDEMKAELRKHPERFSPNVILRGLFQEVILPDVAWIGGGGELAYWLQLKDLFQNYKVPFPVLILRNSFLIVDEKAAILMKKVSLSAEELFAGKEKIFNRLVEKETDFSLNLFKEKKEFENIYEQIHDLVKRVDTTLTTHVNALETRHVKALSGLEKKIFRAEKRKFKEQESHLNKLFSILFPDEELQERVENFMFYYAKWGDSFFQALLDSSLTLEQKFCILQEGSAEP